jgi:hypothetical protein
LRRRSAPVTAAAEQAGAHAEALDRELTAVGAGRLLIVAFFPLLFTFGGSWKGEEKELRGGERVLHQLGQPALKE